MIDVNKFILFAFIINNYLNFILLLLIFKNKKMADLFAMLNQKNREFDKL